MKIKTPRFFAIASTASILAVAIFGFTISFAASNPPSGNVVPNFSAVKVSGNAEIGGTLSNPSGDITVADNLKVNEVLNVLKALVVGTTAVINGAATFNDISTFNGNVNVVGNIQNGTPDDNNRVKVNDYLEVLGKFTVGSKTNLKDAVFYAKNFNLTNADGSKNVRYDGDDFTITGSAGNNIKFGISNADMDFTGDMNIRGNVTIDDNAFKKLTVDGSIETGDLDVKNIINTNSNSISIGSPNLNLSGSTVINTPTYFERSPIVDVFHGGGPIQRMTADWQQPTENYLKIILGNKGYAYDDPAQPTLLHAGKTSGALEATCVDANSFAVSCKYIAGGETSILSLYPNGSKCTFNIKNTGTSAITVTVTPVCMNP